MIIAGLLAYVFVHVNSLRRIKIYVVDNTMSVEASIFLRQKRIK